MKSRILIPAACLAFMSGLTPLAANPTGGTVVAGQAQIGNGANGTLTITQGSNHAIINWGDFSINAGETTRFAQPNSASAVLNRVTGGNPSALLGKLEGNGSIYLINPNGVLVGPNGIIQTGGNFVASTRDLSNDAFLAGGAFNFKGDSAADVENLGFIKSDAGDVILVGRTVKNAGTIEAQQGVAGLAAGDDVLLSVADNDRISVRLVGGSHVAGTGVDNAGTVKAAQAQLSAAGGNVYALAVNNTGFVEATGFARLADGRIVFSADGGDIAVDGKLSAQNADGAGGTIIIGGDYQGGNAAVPNARTTTVAASAEIKADATAANGDGGKVILWADQDTSFAGTISARGGAAGGDGGFAEVSGKRNLDFLGIVDLRAPAGTDGSLLLDPTDLTIDAQSIQTQLGLGDLSITTNSAGADAGDITVTNVSNITINTSAANDLTLTADRDILINGFLSFQAAENTSMGAFIFKAGRDIVLKKAVSFELGSSGGVGSDGISSTVNGAAGADISLGAISLNAGRDISSSNYLRIVASSRGGRGGDGKLDSAAPNVVLGQGGNGGAGGDVSVGSVTIQAGGNISGTGTSSLSMSQIVELTATGGAGGKNYGGGTGGAAGNVIFGNYTVKAGGDITFNSYSDLKITATANGGSGGASGSYNSEPTEAGNGGDGGAGGAVAVGNIVVDAGQDINMQSRIAVQVNAYGGDGSTAIGSNKGKNVGGSGGAGGNASIGTVTFLAERDILSLTKPNVSGPYYDTNYFTAIAPNGQDGLSASIGTDLRQGGAGGAAGTASLGDVTYRAGNNLSSVTTDDQIIGTTSDLWLIAGNNVSLNDSTIKSSARITIVADNNYPASLDYGTGGVYLTGTQLISFSPFAATEASRSGEFSGGENSGVRVFGVDPLLVSLGTSFTPAATGTTNQYYGDASATTGGLYYKAIIKPDPLTITAQDFNLTYGFSALPTFTYTSTGLQSADTITSVSFSTLASVGSNVGTYAITPSNAAITGPGYYDITYVAGVLTISPATLNIAGHNLSKVYGAIVPAITATGTGLQYSQTLASVAHLNPSTTVTAGSNVGNYTFSLAPTLIVPSGATVSNYTLGTVTGGTINVTAAALTIQADNLNRAYGAVNPTLTATFSGLVNGDTSAVVSGFGLSTPTTPASPAGGYAITQTGTATADNYTISFIPGTLIVGNPDILNIAANDFTLTYGFSALPAFTAAMTGFVNGNTVADVTGLLYNTAASVGSNAGTYTIIPYGASAPSNYAITYMDGTLTVNRAALTVSANNAGSVYGSILPTFAGTAAGLQNGDALAGVLNFAPTTTATSGSSIGDYAISPGATLTAAGAVNYTIGAVTPGTLRIGPAMLNVAANNASTTYGTAIPTLTASTSGLANGDAQSAVVALAPTTAVPVGLGSNAGTYVINANPTLLGAIPNYTLGTITPGTLTIHPASLTVTANNATRVYGAEDPIFTATFTGLVNGDAAASVATLAPTTNATVGSNVGTYFIQPGVTLLSSNYTVGTAEAGLFTISPATLNFAMRDATMIYNSTPDLSTTVSGLRNGDRWEDVGSFLYTLARFDPYNSFPNSYDQDLLRASLENQNVGTYETRPNPKLIGTRPNYVIGTVSNANVTVTPREVTVYLTANDLARSSRSWYPNIEDLSRVPGIRLSDGSQFSGNTIVQKITGSTGHNDVFVFTFEGMKPSDLASTPPSMSTTVMPTLGYASNLQVGANTYYNGPMITGLYINPNWFYAKNYTFAIGVPNPGALQYMASTPSTLTAGDTATIAGTPALNAIYSFRGAELGSLDGFDLSRSKFGYITNYTGGAQSGIYWILPTLPTGVLPNHAVRGVPSALDNIYPATSGNTVDSIVLPTANLSETDAGVYWYSPLVPDKELRITALNPGYVKVFNTSGGIERGNIQALGNYFTQRAEDEAADSAATNKGRQYNREIGPPILTTNATEATPRFNLSSGSVLGYPAYQTAEVFSAVALFLRASKLPSDHASVSNWLKANDNSTGKAAILPYMAQYISEIAANPGTPAQQVLLNRVAEAVRENRIAAYRKVEAEYNAWKADQAAVKAGKMPTLYSLFDLGEAPPQSLINKLALAKNGLSDSDLKGTSVAIGMSVSAGATAATLTGMALTGASTSVPAGLMPFATTGLAVGTAVTGPLIAAAFVAVIVADSAGKVAKMQKFDNDLAALKSSSYTQTSVSSILAQGKSGTAEMLNALRELNNI